MNASQIVEAYKEEDKRTSHGCVMDNWDAGFLTGKRFLCAKVVCILDEVKEFGELSPNDLEEKVLDRLKKLV